MPHAGGLPAKVLGLVCAALGARDWARGQTAGEAHQLQAQSKATHVAGVQWRP